MAKPLYRQQANPKDLKANQALALINFQTRQSSRLAKLDPEGT